MQTEKSSNFSFSGYNLMKAIKGNWKSIKEILKVGVPFFLGMQFFTANPVYIGIVTILGKSVLDAIEFYFSEVNL